MYIRSVHVENIRCIESLKWNVPPGKEAGWHVIIGDNASGKTTLLRAIALALVGPREAEALQQDWSRWLRRGERSGRVRIDLSCDRSVDNWRGQSGPREKVSIGAKLTEHWGEIRIGAWGTAPDPRTHVWSGKAGWFSAIFGAFRRLSGGIPELQNLYRSRPRLARHLSVFKEDAALIECWKWLQQSKTKQLEEPAEGFLVDSVKWLINGSGLLPSNVEMNKVSMDEITFRVGSRTDIPLLDLSDGYRSILALVFEIVYQMALTYQTQDIFEIGEKTFVKMPGVVLVDEIDAHLHPTWQAQIGNWFRKYFPAVQFIVATHSPLVCQSAANSTIFRLPRAGSSEEGRMLQGVEFDRLVYGNVLDAYGTEAFGPDVTRSESSRACLRRLAELNLKELKQGLTGRDRKEQRRLRAMMPTAASTTVL